MMERLRIERDLKKLKESQARLRQRWLDADLKIHVLENLLEQVDDDKEEDTFCD